MVENNVLIIAAHPSHPIKAVSSPSSSIHIPHTNYSLCSFALCFVIVVREMNRGDLFIHRSPQVTNASGFIFLPPD